MAEKLHTVQVGVAGEYFVAAELSRRGYVATLTLRNTRGIDLLASNLDATKAVGIQIKATRNPKPDWILSKKAEVDVAENLFYVFVRLPAQGQPDYYIVPRSVVAQFVRDTHKEWLAKPGRRVAVHKDTDMRRFKDPGGKYRERWDLLGLD